MPRVADTRDVNVQAAAAQLSTLNMSSSALAGTATLQSVDPSAGPGGSPGPTPLRASSDTAMVSQLGQNMYAASLHSHAAGAAHDDAE